MLTTSRANAPTITNLKLNLTPKPDEGHKQPITVHLSFTSGQEPIRIQQPYLLLT